MYKIDYSKQSKNDLLPVDYRVEPNISILKSLLKPLQWFNDLFFDSYKTGATATAYSAGTYNLGDQILFNKSVYESLIDSNTDAPTVSTSWMKIQDSFIGADERVLYTTSRLMLEYALNKWFGTTFRQPSVGTSDIYITLNVVPTPVFVSGINESESSTVSNLSSSQYVINDYSFTDINSFDINVPVAVYNALGDAGNRDNIFRSFSNKYVCEGLFYAIVTY